MLQYILITDELTDAVTPDFDSFVNKFKTEMLKNPRLIIDRVSSDAPNKLNQWMEVKGYLASEAVLISSLSSFITTSAALKITCIQYVSSVTNMDAVYTADMLIEGFEDINYKFIETIYMHSHGFPVTFGITDRLLIRELSLDDSSALINICCSIKHNSPVANNFFPNSTATPDDETKFLESYIKYQYGFYGYGYWGVFLKDSNQLVGCCGIENKTYNEIDYLELGFLIAANYQNKGYATEALNFIIQYVSEKLFLDKLTAFIEPQNTASIKVAENNGLKYVSQVMRNNILCNLYQT